MPADRVVTAAGIIRIVRSRDGGGEGGRRVKSIATLNNRIDESYTISRDVKVNYRFMVYFLFIILTAASKVL